MHTPVLNKVGIWVLKEFLTVSARNRNRAGDVERLIVWRAWADAQVDAAAKILTERETRRGRRQKSYAGTQKTP